jgi:hypothetical protein
MRFRSKSYSWLWLATMKENIDIHPGLQGLVSLNAVDETCLLSSIA